MNADGSGSGAVGLERSCEAGAGDWIRQSEPVGGVELFEARLRGIGYRRHRHDAYAIGLTNLGVQAFAYRGATHLSMPGNVVVLHPDEAHDGYPGAASGFGYRQVYVDPAAIFDAARALTGRARPLPFVRCPVTANPTLAAAIEAAFRHEQSPLAIADVIVRLAEGLLASDPGPGRAELPRRLDLVAIDRARQLLDAETSKVVALSDLEAATGLDRYDLARQFRAVVGTSPYRYSLMRRLGRARRLIAFGQPLADAAFETGFADQAHLTRMFKAAFGVTPGQHRALSVSGRR